MNRDDSAYNIIGKKMIKTFDRFLDHRGRGVIYLDSELNIVKSNNVASDFLLQKYCLVSRNGKLFALEKEDNQKLVDGFLMGIKQGNVGAIFLKKKGQNEPCRIDFHPVLDGFEIDEQKAVLMLEIDRYAKSINILSKAIQDYYSLTSAELSLVEAVHQEATLNEYAEEKSIKISTVRWTLGNVFSKTGTKSQRELQSLVSIFSI